MSDLKELYPDIAPPPDRSPKKQTSDLWAPDLNFTQNLIFHDAHRYILADGERGSGKTFGHLHKLVRHSFENWDALSLLIAPVIRTAKWGIGHDLETYVLPTWRDGNMYPEWLNGVRHPKADQLMDEGMGLEFTKSKLDPQTRDRVIYIGNMHGGWSSVIILSIPYEASVADRIKSMNPSFVLLDEMTNLHGKSYFTDIAAQLGRRKHITGPQQYCGACNPDGPKNWVHEVFFKDCIDEKNGVEWPDGIKRHRDYARYHVPVGENLRHLRPGYAEGLYQVYKDPIVRRRMLGGEWIDRPSGEAIFRDYFIPEIHVRGDCEKKIGIRPHAMFPIRVGYDPGPKNFSIHFEQMISVKDRMVWTAFDELNFVGKITPTKAVVPKVLARMQHWCDLVGHTFAFEHISDSSAFNQKNSEGSFYANDIERYSRGKIRLKSCIGGKDPQGRDSVPARVQMVIAMFLEEQFLISAMLEKTIDMFQQMISKKGKLGEYDEFQGLRPVRSPYVHSFDSLTYPPFKLMYAPSRFGPTTGLVEFQPKIYQCGDAA